MSLIEIVLLLLPHVTTFFTPCFFSVDAFFLNDLSVLLFTTDPLLTPCTPPLRLFLVIFLLVDLASFQKTLGRPDPQWVPPPTSHQLGALPLNPQFCLRGIYRASSALSFSCDCHLPTPIAPTNLILPLTRTPCQLSFSPFFNKAWLHLTFSLPRLWRPFNLRIFANPPFFPATLQVAVHLVFFPGSYRFKHFFPMFKRVAFNFFSPYPPYPI